MVVGSVIAMFRAIPKKIWNWVVYQTTVSLIVTDENNEFDWLRKWLQQQNIVKKARHIDVSTGNGRKWWRTQEENTVITPAPGNHWMIYRGRPLAVKVVRLDDTKSGEYKEWIKFTMLGRNSGFFRKMVQDIIDQKKKDVPTPKLFIWNKDMWRQINPYEPRCLDTVIFSNGLKKELVKDIENFKNSQAWYAEMGIPYHRGYLFEGPAGTGKTSLVVGLSRYFNAQVYILKISDMSDAVLRDAVFATAPNSFIILEDIDCTKAAANRVPVKKDGNTDSDVVELFGVTLSGLLNVLDGMLAPSGVMFFMTTNHVEKLDPALIRPGRIDVQKHIGLADDYQKIELYKKFFPGEIIPYELRNKSMTMADMQQVLMVEKAKRIEIKDV